MLITYPYRNNLSTYAAGFADRQSRQGPEIPAAVPTGGGGQALSKSRMQFKNTSDTTLQTDTNQHNAGGELHAKLIGRRRAWPRCRWAVAGPGRASRSTTPSRQARVWRSRGRAAAHRHTQRPGPTQQATRRPEICRGSRPRGGPPPTGTHSGPARQTQRSRPAPQGPGGSRIRPLGGSQRLFQRIWVPSEPRRWQASTTRAAMPASADLPHVRGSYCFFTPTSPSILRTPS